VQGGDRLPWASSDPEGTLATYRQENEGIRPPEFFEMAPLAPLDAAAKQKVLGQIARASALIFTSGDQNKLLDVAQDPDIKAAILARYRRTSRAGIFRWVPTMRYGSSPRASNLTR